MLREVICTRWEGRTGLGLKYNEWHCKENWPLSLWLHNAQKSIDVHYVLESMVMCFPFLVQLLNLFLKRSIDILTCVERSFRSSCPRIFYAITIVKIQFSHCIVSSMIGIHYGGLNKSNRNIPSVLKFILMSVKKKQGEKPLSELSTCPKNYLPIDYAQLSVSSFVQKSCWNCVGNFSVAKFRLKSNFNVTYLHFILWPII